MHMHSGTTDWLKMVTGLGFIVLVFWWLEGAIGKSAAVWVAGALVFAGAVVIGMLLTHASQKMTLGAITKFNADDAQIDRYRLQTMTESQKGQTAWDKAQAQLSVIEAKRVDKLADQRAKLLTDAEREKWNAQQGAKADTWTWADDEAGDSFQEWR